MIDLLLDTHTFIWWVNDPQRLSTAAFVAISDRKRKIYVSAVTTIEIEIKKAQNRLAFDHDIEVLLHEKDFLELPIRHKHAKLLPTLPPLHKDPFDKILIAQAISEDLILVSADREIFKYNLPIIRT